MEGVQMTRYIGTKPYLVFFEFEEGLAFFSCAIVAFVLLDGMILQLGTLSLGVAAAHYIKVFKTKYPKGLIIRILYYYGFRTTKRFPPTNYKRFVG